MSYELILIVDFACVFSYTRTFKKYIRITVQLLIMLTQNTMLTQTSSKNLSIELSQHNFEKINELVDEGLFDNVDDFLNEAVNEKLEDMEPITLRDIPYEQQRREIIAYAKSHDDFDAIDVSDELLLDVFEVNDIMVELIKEGILEEL